MIDAAFYFGKHNGQQVSEVPTQYLRWCVRTLTDIEPRLLESIREELTRRRHQDGQQAHDENARREREARANSARQYSPPVQWAGIVREGYRGLALDFHPDRGGSNEAMRVINEAHDRLRQLVGV